MYVIEASDFHNNGNCRVLANPFYPHKYTTVLQHVRGFATEADALEYLAEETDMNGHVRTIESLAYMT